LKSVRIPAKICLDWRKNPSPLDALPIIKQGLGNGNGKYWLYQTFFRNLNFTLYMHRKFIGFRCVFLLPENSP